MYIDKKEFISEIRLNLISSTILFKTVLFTVYTVDKRLVVKGLKIKYKVLSVCLILFCLAIDFLFEFIIHIKHNTYFFSFVFFNRLRNV